MIFDLGFVSLFPSVAFQGLVDQVWIDGSGNDFIISPSFADWANCRRILTISKPSARSNHPPAESSNSPRGNAQNSECELICTFKFIPEEEGKHCFMLESPLS